MSYYFSSLVWHAASFGQPSEHAAEDQRYDELGGDPNEQTALVRLGGSVAGGHRICRGSVGGAEVHGLEL